VFTEVAPPLLLVTQIVEDDDEDEAALEPIDIEDIDGPTGLLLQADKTKPAAKSMHIANDDIFMFSPPFQFRFFCYLTVKLPPPPRLL